MDLDANPVLTETVEKITPIKEWLVEYVGERHNPEDREVTVEMVVNTVADEFPEFLMVVAEENWIRNIIFYCDGTIYYTIRRNIIERIFCDWLC